MLVDRMPGEHVGGDRMQSVQSNGGKRQSLRRRFGVLLLSARLGCAASRRLLVVGLSTEKSERSRVSDKHGSNRCTGLFRRRSVPVLSEKHSRRWKQVAKFNLITALVDFTHRLC